MTEKTIAALRRADRAVAGAVVALVSLVAMGLASYAPYTEQSPVKIPLAPTQERPVQLRLPQPVRYVPPPVVVPLPSPDEIAVMRAMAEERCLAEAMYYEARGEGVEGEEAIAEVVFHRMHSAGYPRSICGVVYQGAHLQHSCQFSFACDGELDQRKSYGAWTRARFLAARIMSGIVQLGDITGDAISFHAVDVQPEWADRLERTIQIGNHIFYRALPRTKAS